MIPGISFDPLALTPFDTRKKAKTSSVADATEDFDKGDPVEELGADLVQSHIFPCLDGVSLARCTVVSKRWEGLSQLDSLWAPLCFQLWRKRAHLPLPLMQAKNHMGAMEVYSMFREDLAQERLLKEEMCTRIWELHVKPACGPYWASLDPSNQGGTALQRYFHCDGSITADPNDPIWGGQESSWSFVNGKPSSSDQLLKINYWPVFNISRLSDGRWHLENLWATYTTQRSLPFETNQKIWHKLCRRCHSPRLLRTVPRTLEYSVLEPDVLPSPSQDLDIEDHENNVELFDLNVILVNGAIKVGELLQECPGKLLNHSQNDLI